MLVAVAVLERTAGFGHCIEANTFRLATVNVAANGGLVLSGSVHRGWDYSSAPECEARGCEILEEIEPFALTEEQASVLRGRIAALPPEQCVGELNPACDPCPGGEQLLALDEAKFFLPVCVPACFGYAQNFVDVTQVFDSLVP